MSPRPRREGAAKRRVLGEAAREETPAADLSAFQRTTPRPTADATAAEPAGASTPANAPTPAPKPPTRTLRSVPKQAPVSTSEGSDLANGAFGGDDDAPAYVALLEGNLRQANYSVPPALDERLRGLRAQLGVEYPQAQVLRGLIAMRFPIEAAADLRREIMEFQLVARHAAQAGHRNVTINIPLRSAMLDEIDRLNGQARAGKSGPPRRRSLFVGSILWAAVLRSETDPDQLRDELEQFDLYEHLARVL